MGNVKNDVVHDIHIEDRPEFCLAALVKLAGTVAAVVWLRLKLTTGGRPVSVFRETAAVIAPGESLLPMLAAAMISV